MRFLHTADWHLGRLFHGTSLVADQSRLLEQILTLARESRIDALLLAGDVYDRAIPPADAVALFDDFLSRMALDLQIPVIAIAGNHDSAERLGFGARLLAGRGVHLCGRFEARATSVTLADESGEVVVHALPYADPPQMRAVLADDTLLDHARALSAAADRIRAAHPPGRRAVLMTHAFVAGCEESESERPLSVGGSGAVPSSALHGFAYVALGHLHRPQRAGADHIRYAGSLAKYSFSEIDHVKSVSLVDLDAAGGVQVETVALTPPRELRCIEGSLDALLRGPAAGESREDYLLVRLLDTGALLDPIGRLREIYPNVMQLERPALFEGGASVVATRRERTPKQLFGDFFEQVTGAPLSQAEREAFAESVGADQEAEREARSEPEGGR